MKGPIHLTVDLLDVTAVKAGFDAAQARINKLADRVGELLDTQAELLEVLQTISLSLPPPQSHRCAEVLDSRAVAINLVHATLRKFGATP